VTPAERDVWGVITDGAFPTRGMMVAYSMRWAELFIKSPFLRGLIPRWLFVLLAGLGRRRAERRLNCRYPDVERAVARLAPRPWLSIHGERDNYVTPDVARELFRYGNGPKEMWLVPDAKHNRCRERDPKAYAARILAFLDRFAPRRPVTSQPPLVPSHDELPATYAGALSAPKLASEIPSALG